MLCFEFFSIRYFSFYYSLLSTQRHSRVPAHLYHFARAFQPNKYEMRNVSPASIEYYRYTIKVRAYWLGVDSNTMVLYGEPDRKKNRNDGTMSCGFTLLRV